MYYSWFVTISVELPILVPFSRPVVTDYRGFVTISVKLPFLVPFYRFGVPYDESPVDTFEHFSVRFLFLDEDEADYHDILMESRITELAKILVPDKFVATDEYRDSIVMLKTWRTLHVGVHSTYYTDMCNKSVIEKIYDKQTLYDSAVMTARQAIVDSFMDIVNKIKNSDDWITI